MKHLLTILSLILFAAGAATAQLTAQFIPDSLTRALWHFNESSGYVVHDTAAKARDRFLESEKQFYTRLIAERLQSIQR